MKTAFRFASVGLLIFSTSVLAEPLKLNARRQVEGEKGKGNWKEEHAVLDWEGKKTALIICDMWNEHWCKGATERVGEMAPRMNEVVKAARAKWVFIAFLALAAFLLFTEHRAHLLGFLPWLILLACPLMHLLMHHGHGGHGGGHEGHDHRARPTNTPGEDR